MTVTRKQPAAVKRSSRRHAATFNVSQVSRSLRNRDTNVKSQITCTQPSVKMSRKAARPQLQKHASVADDHETEATIVRVSTARKKAAHAVRRGPKQKPGNGTASTKQLTAATNPRCATTNTDPTAPNDAKNESGPEKCSGAGSMNLEL
jgi:hypothetical protein